MLYCPHCVAALSAYMAHVTHASEALGLSPEALLITDILRVSTYVGPAAAFETFITDRQLHTF